MRQCFHAKESATKHLNLIYNFESKQKTLSYSLCGTVWCGGRLSVEIFWNVFVSGHLILENRWNAKWGEKSKFWIDFEFSAASQTHNVMAGKGIAEIGFWKRKFFEKKKLKKSTYIFIANFIININRNFVETYSHWTDTPLNPYISDRYTAKAQWHTKGDNPPNSNWKNDLKLNELKKWQNQIGQKKD